MCSFSGSRKNVICVVDDGVTPLVPDPPAAMSLSGACAATDETALPFILLANGASRLSTGATMCANRFRNSIAGCESFPFNSSMYRWHSIGQSSSCSSLLMAWFCDWTNCMNLAKKNGTRGEKQFQNVWQIGTVKTLTLWIVARQSGNCYWGTIHLSIKRN